MPAPEPPPTVYQERTTLAWQRTGLALVAGSAIVARLTLDRLGTYAVASVLVVMALVAWVMSEGNRRHHRGGVDTPRSRGGRAPLALATATAMIALTELTALLAAAAETR